MATLTSVSDEKFDFENGIFEGVFRPVADPIKLLFFPNTEFFYFLLLS